MTAEIVPFGKYKGQPVEALIADRDYADWLSQQPWFRDRYAPTYQMIVNYGKAPAETPEHNEMQAAFLDPAWALTVAAAAWDHIPFDHATKRAAAWIKRLGALPAEWAPQGRHLPPVPVHTQFEDRGWDVTYNIRSATTEIRVAAPACTCDRGEHQDWKDVGCPQAITKDWGAGHGYGYYRDDDANIRQALLKGRAVTLDADHWRVLVECKPDLGDDFPAVLRQIKARDADRYRERSVLLVRRAQFERVSLDNVSAIFEAAAIKLLIEADVNRG